MQIQARHERMEVEVLQQGRSCTHLPPRCSEPALPTTPHKGPWHTASSDLLLQRVAHLLPPDQAARCRDRTTQNFFRNRYESLAHTPLLQQQTFPAMRRLAQA